MIPVRLKKVAAEVEDAVVMVITEEAMANLEMAVKVEVKGGTKSEVVAEIEGVMISAAAEVIEKRDVDTKIENDWSS